MALGSGKYGEECSKILEETEAEGVILVVISGNKGSGFSCHASPEVVAELPSILENLSKQIKGSMH